MSGSMPSADSRIDDLESRLAFQDDTVSTLNDALAAQQARISSLENTLQRIIELLKDRGADLDAPDEPPPHY